MSKTGRNDPCPCGSGKKYKHCCLDKAMIIPFPGTDAPDRADQFEEYQDFAENYDGPGDPPSFMQWRGDPNPATEFIEKMRRDIGGRVFESGEELEAYVNRYQAKERAAPVADFLGLSSDIMHNIIHGMAAGNTGFLELSAAMPDEDLLRIPVMRQALAILRRLRQAGPVKATAKGNFPRAMVHALYDEAYREFQEFEYKPVNEEDLVELTAHKYLLKNAGLIRLHKNHYSPTKKATGLLDNEEYGKLYKMLFYFWLDGFNWDFLDRYDELPLIQHAALFGLYILKKKAGEDFVPLEDLGKTFLEAFPDLEKIVAPRYGTPAEYITGCFHHRFLRRFCLSFGLVSRKSIGELHEMKYLYKTTDFFNKYIAFHA